MGRNPLANGHTVDLRLIDDIKVCEAGLRLDHLIRNALDPSFHRNFPSMDHLSAINFFVEQINERMQAVPLLEKTRDFIEPRLRLCREMLTQADAELAENGYPPVSSSDFNQVILTNCQTSESIVFNNPFSGHITSWSASPAFDNFSYYWK